MEKGMNSKAYYTLITGASSGIGKSMAYECAARDMNLLLVALPGSGLEEIAADIGEKFAVKTAVLNVDLTDRDGPESVYRFTLENGLVVNNLINNAGVGYNGLCHSMSLQFADQMILLNTRATTLLVLLFLHELLKVPGSHILNIGSMASFTPLPGKSIYAASKAYILFFSKALRAELKGTGLSVTSVYPMGVRTNLTVRDRIKKSGLIARHGVLDPDEVAKIALDGMLKRKKVIIPGRMGKAVYLVGQLIPQGIVLRIMEKEIKRAIHD